MIRREFLAILGAGTAGAFLPISADGTCETKPEYVAADSVNDENFWVFMLIALYGDKDGKKTNDELMELAFKLGILVKKG